MTTESTVNEMADTPAGDAPTPPPNPPPGVTSDSDEITPEPSRDPLAALRERDHPFD